VPGPRREDFPVLDRLTYLSTASAGLVPASVVTVVAALFHRRTCETVRRGGRHLGHPVS
jgi:hypothetical protein